MPARTNDWTLREGAWTVATDSRSSAAEPPPPPHADRPSGLAPPVSRPRHRHGSGHRHSNSSRKKLWVLQAIIAALLVVIVVGSTVAIVGYGKLEHFRHRAAVLDVQVGQMEAELAEAREQLGEMDNNLRVMLANRIPGISEISFTRPIEVNEGYVKSVTFLRGADEEQPIQFSTVLENGRNVPIDPKVKIVLFDEVGLQTGAVTLDKKQAGKDVAHAEMQPGETRQYTGRIPLERKEPSEYFALEVQ